MSTPSPKPHLVLIHGSWHTPSIWSHLLPLLHAHGYTTHTPFNPSVSSAGPQVTHRTDATHIAALTRSLSDAGHLIILIMHSYGGVPGTESTRSLLRASREAAGQPGGIIALVYLSAFLLRKGECVADTMDPPPRQAFDVDRDGRIAPPGDVRFCYSDLEPREQVLRQKELRPMSVGAWESRLEDEGWRDVPSVSYLMCRDDEAIRFEEQRGMVDRVEIEGCRVKIEIVESGHSPMLRCPERVVEVIRRAAGEDF